MVTVDKSVAERKSKVVAVVSLMYQEGRPEEFVCYKCSHKMAADIQDTIGALNMQAFSGWPL